ncbi:hypothetical protein M378DRAFT_65731 [Amanita muscaria Koide BX008]|uniref:T6SS Phospholipase effector Tle1-like catalytic domain-containing protein n=1 Tax=Amanita muscaria (strain Koide BX008) TaxID=946122 RepID=A0A0C2XNH7_AMAMK|nr:hypothetical protein M378DRAFT_65731 [Amanita muscaria Koide BX008]
MQSEPPLSPRPHSGPHPGGSRCLILCFDGTGNSFGEQNSNVVRFFRALRKDLPNEQLVYYQPGVGTYVTGAPFVTKFAKLFWSTLDAALALGLDDHIQQGYQFIIQNYREGDKICIFGFSRGAHTARAVAGMVYKVGIISKENVQQIEFALGVNNTSGYYGHHLSHEFKSTFSPQVHFVGVWDTVASVGIIQRPNPYTSLEYSVRTFRHALALDERRARFRPSLWIEPEREKDLDVDIPVPEINRNTEDFDAWTYEPPDRDYADVKEVWFAGVHADVGGGSHEGARKKSLSLIPLRWMIKECILSKTGIRFNPEYLDSQLRFNLRGLKKEIQGIGELQDTYWDIEFYLQKQKERARRKKINRMPDIRGVDKFFTSWPGFFDIVESSENLYDNARDIGDRIFDQLTHRSTWWILEVLPTFSSFQDQSGDWIRSRVSNWGRGRYVPFNPDNKILVHDSVRRRIELTKDLPYPYTPRAEDWADILELVTWIDESANDMIVSAPE